MQTPAPLLANRLEALVLQMASRATLTCRFVGGGKLHGVGIPSPLYCRTCGEHRDWHTVAEAAARVRPPAALSPDDRHARLVATLIGRHN